MTIPSIILNPPWQDKASRIKAPKLPETLSISELPNLFLKENPVPLSEDNVQNLLGLLFKSDIKQWVEPLTDDTVKTLVAQFEPTSLHAFANALAQQVGIDWYGYAVLSPFDFETVESFRGYIDGKTERTEGNPTVYEKKPTQTTFAHQLIRLLALNFRITGSPHALRGLFLQQQKGKKSYRNFCLDTINKLGDDMGLNLIELQDIAVPDFGFYQGKKPFTLGEHEINFRLDNHFKLGVYEQNIRLKTLPKATKNDDKAVWQQAIDWQKETQKQLNQLYRDLPKTLLLELKYQYRRGFRHFNEFYLNHAVLNQFAQGIVWGLFEQKENRKNPQNPITEFHKAFLVTSDGSWLDSHYDDIKPHILHDIVGDRAIDFFIVPLHPVYISDSEQSALAHMLVDFEIIQPCPQLSIQAYRATEEEWQKGIINRFDNVNLSHSEFSGVYRHSFSLIYNNDSYEIGFKLTNKHNGEIIAQFVEPVKTYSPINVQIEPIAIDQTTNKVLLNNLLEMLYSAQNRLN